MHLEEQQENQKRNICLAYQEFKIQSKQPQHPLLFLELLLRMALVLINLKELTFKCSIVPIFQVFNCIQVIILTP